MFRPSSRKLLMFIFRILFLYPFTLPIIRFRTLGSKIAEKCSLLPFKDNLEAYLVVIYSFYISVISSLPSPGFRDKLLACISVFKPIYTSKSNGAFECYFCARYCPCTVPVQYSVEP